MSDIFIGASLALLALAGWATWMDRRRANRSDLDRVGWVSWPLVMVLSLTAAMMTVLLIAAG